MTDHGKAYGENPPTAFPKALEIERTDFHISSVPTTAANLTQFKTRKEPFPVRLTFAPFRLILRLEKTLPSLATESCHLSDLPTTQTSPIKGNVKRKIFPIGSIPSHCCQGIQPHCLSVHSQAVRPVSSPRAQRRYASSPLWFHFAVVTTPIVF